MQINLAPFLSRRTHKVLAILVLCFQIQKMAFSQPQSVLSSLNGSISNIPFVFEGLIESAEVFAGDGAGNRLPFSAANWQDSIGSFASNSYPEVFGYTLASIRICRLYKGNIDPAEPLVVLTKSNAFRNICARVTQKGDTVISYELPYHSDGWEEFQLLLPHPMYGVKRLFFCDQLLPIDTSQYRANKKWSNLHALIQVPIAPRFSLLPDQPKAYAILYPHIFYSQRDLAKFLIQIRTISAYPKNLCSDSYRPHD